MRDIEQIRAENRLLPLNPDGHIVSPLYSPSHRYRAQILDWADANPTLVPDWLKHDLTLYGKGFRNQVQLDREGRCSTPEEQ